MSTIINILHVSDLHFSGSENKDINIVCAELFKDLVTLKQSYSLNVDLVAFTGDLVDRGGSDADYSEAKSIFINGVLKATGLTLERFFITPGNHDILRANINKFYELGMKSTLINRQEVNEFIDSIETDTQALNRLDLFNRFKTSIDTGNARLSGKLCSAHVLQIGGKRIGVACINSAWRAQGGVEDYGKLIVGERQIDQCSSALDGCDLKIALLHHPFEWLAEFDKRDSRRFLLSNFQMILFGHLHEAEPQSLSTVHGTSLISQAGCLYQSRDFFNGYSVTSINMSDLSGKTHLRTYFDRRPAFDEAVDVAPHGRYPFRIQR
jgi:predicted MPP superfamily phosphohydrolase